MCGIFQCCVCLISSVANSSLANKLVEDFLREENILIDKNCEVRLKRAVCQHLSNPDFTTFTIRLAIGFQSETDTKHFLQYYEVSYITLFVNIIISTTSLQIIQQGKSIMIVSVDDNSKSPNKEYLRESFKPHVK